MLVIAGVSWDLNRFLQFIFTALVIAIGLHTLVKNTASKYFEVDANFEGDHHPSSPTSTMNGVLNSDELVCAVCASHATKKCSRCICVRYCSIKCQQSDWISGHREKCKYYSRASRPIKKPEDVVISPFPEEYTSSEFRVQGFPFHAHDPESLFPSPNSPPPPPPEDIPEEELSRYFGGDRPPSPIASTVEEDLKEIEVTLQGEIPTNVEEVRAFRTTLYRLGSSNLVTSSQQELFKQLALQIGDYLGFRDQHDRVSLGLDQMQMLQASKAALKKTYADLEVERKFILQRQKEVDERMIFLQEQQEKIRKELEQLAPETMRLAESLRSTNSRRCSLYTDSTRVDTELNPLLSQKACLEMDFATSKDGLEAQRLSWECFKFKISVAHANALVPPVSTDMGHLHVEEP